MPWCTVPEGGGVASTSLPGPSCEAASVLYCCVNTWILSVSGYCMTSGLRGLGPTSIIFFWRAKSRRLSATAEGSNASYKILHTTVRNINIINIKYLQSWSSRTHSKEHRIHVLTLQTFQTMQVSDTVNYNPRDVVGNHLPNGATFNDLQSVMLTRTGHARTRTRTKRIQGPGQGQGLDLQGQRQGQGLHLQLLTASCS